jgi:hypothetical protein
MNIYQFLSNLKGRFILILLIVTFSYSNSYGQHLFSVNYGDLSRDNANLIRTEVARISASISTISMTKNRNNKDVCSFSLSSIQNTKIIILNEETGNSVEITPVDGTTQFELSPFFVEELKQAALGDADRYLIVEADNDFLVRNVASVSVANQKAFIPRYFYGPKENVKEALPKDRRIIHVFKEKPILISQFIDLLQQTQSFSLKENELCLFYNNKNNYLLFKRLES